MIEYDDYRSDSYGLDDDRHELGSDEGDPLIHRLRAMRWAQIPEDIRTRCWEDIRKRMDEREDPARGGVPEPPPGVNCDRYAFSRRREPVHTFTPRRLATAQPRQTRSLVPAWSSR